MNDLPKSEKFKILLNHFFQIIRNRVVVKTQWTHAISLATCRKCVNLSKWDRRAVLGSGLVLVSWLIATHLQFHIDFDRVFYSGNRCNISGYDGSRGPKRSLTRIAVGVTPNVVTVGAIDTRRIGRGRS